MSGHACNARCDRGGHFVLAEYRPKHRANTRVDSCSFWHGAGCRAMTSKYPAEFVPRHRAEVTP